MLAGVLSVARAEHRPYRETSEAIKGTQTHQEAQKIGQLQRNVFKVLWEMKHKRHHKTRTGHQGREDIERYLRESKGTHEH